MSQRNWIAASSAILLVALAALGVMTAAAPVPTKETLPAVQFVGHDSKISTARYVLVRDEKSWAELWAEHTGIAQAHGAMARHAAPIIDFTRFMVVGVFEGSTTNTDGELAHSVAATADALRVRYHASTFQTSSSGGQGDPGVKTSPFGLWVIQTSDTPIVIEEGRRGLKNSPLSWKEVKRFNAK